MSRPHYAEEHGPGQADYYAHDYPHGYYEDSDYHHHPDYHQSYEYDYGYDYNQDPAYYQDDRDYYEYQQQQPSRIPGPANQSSLREHTPGMTHERERERRLDQRQPYPSHAQSSAWQASQEAYDGAGYGDELAMSDQWPLPASPMQAPPRTPPRSLRTPPRRPQRPDEPQLNDSPQSVPHITPASRQFHQSSPNSHHGNGHWNGEGYSYAPPPTFPPPNRPPPQAMAPQPAAAQYATPQAPRQVVYGQANQRPPLGPPPSARRGTSSFYPQVGPVHPIVEESESMRSSIRTGSFRATSVQISGHNSKISVASSNAIPIGLEAPRMIRPDFTSSSEDSFIESPVDTALGKQKSNDAVEHASRDLESPEILLVRQASLGRKQRPTLTTVKSSEKSNGNSAEITALPAMPSASMSEIERARAIAKNQLEGQAQSGASDADRKAGNAAIKAAATEHIVRSTSRREANGAGANGIPSRSAKPFQTPSSEDSPAGNGLTRKRSKEFAALANELHPVRSQPRSPLAPAVDPNVENILQSLQKGGAISEKEAEELRTPMGGMSGRKRPPRLDVDAVRDAEARGSLSSLPELIKRATRLASNLDRGKTASRLGMNWIDGARDDEKRRSHRSSGMLSAYPPGGTLTPDGRADKGASFGRWSRMMRHSSLGSDSDGGETKPKRTCCGMPLWLFIVLLILLFMLVAAAVVVPVLLVVVLPHKNGTRSSATSMGQCEKQLTCGNGGSNILSTNGFCECLCVNGYTGTSCQTYSATGCTMTTIGSVTNATVGDAIPRLLEDAKSNFSVPLDSQSVLGLFSSSGLSCSTQNALVTFNGKSSKRDTFEVDDVLPIIHVRQDATPTSSTTATATSSNSSATSTASVNKQLDFARVAVLYVLQVSSDVDRAATAQENLQDYFQDDQTSAGSAANARNISLGNGFTCNLNSLSLELSNGTSVGGS